MMELIKIICLIQIAMLNKNLVQDYKYYIILVALEIKKVGEWNVELKGVAQCCAI